MPLTLPNLDDRNFDDLVAAGKRMIPGLAPSWTDHNPSDPGIALIELFASIAEMLMYRADRVSDANREAFVKLLRGNPSWRPTKSIDEEIREAVLELRREIRAVTAADFRRLAECFVGHASTGSPTLKPVARAHCLPGCIADAKPPLFDAPAHVSVLIVPQSTAPLPVPDVGLIQALAKDLAPRCLLTTRLHVAGPRYLKVRVRIRTTVFADQNETTVRQRIEQRLQDFFHPLKGGTDGLGWPFGGAIYRSALYAVLDGIDGVDFAEPIPAQPDNMVLNTETTNRNIDNGAVIRLEPDELVELAPFASSLTKANADPSLSYIDVNRLVEILPEE